MGTRDTRKPRIAQLKRDIVAANKELMEVIVAAKTEEEKVALKDTIALSKATRQAREGEIATLRMNKTGSTFTEFMPHKGGNRRQAKQAKHAKRRNGSTGSNRGERIVGKR